MSTKLTDTVRVSMERRFRRCSGTAVPIHRRRVVAVAFPRLWCCRSGCVAAVTSRSAGTPGVAGALILGHATPDAVTLGGGEGVGAAVGEHGAILADLFGGALTLGPGRAAFTVRGEEDLGVCTAAGGAALPGKVEEVVRMIRHCGICRFRSRTVKRFAGKRACASANGGIGPIADGGCTENRYGYGLVWPPLREGSGTESAQKRPRHDAANASGFRL